jgi:hypothetical protein
MEVGVNYMWGYNKYGLYFGTHWRFGEAERELWMDQWLTEFERNLVRWRQNDLRITVVRIFLYCNLQSYGNVNANGKWELPSPSHPHYLSFFARYVDHFTRMLDSCRKTGMKVIPSLVDFAIGQPTPSITQEERWSIVTDRAVREQFFAQAFRPLLQISAQPEYAPSIFAWEVMNEPHWLQSTQWPDHSGNRWWVDVDPPRCTQAELWEFLHAGLREIHAYSGLQSTIGHRFYRDCLGFPHGSIPQFHYYPTFYNADPTPLPAYDPRGQVRKAFLGEFAAGTQGHEWTGLWGKDGPGPRERVRERLLKLNELGYRLGMIWPDLDWNGNPGDPDPKLSPEALEGIRDYWRLAP